MRTTLRAIAEHPHLQLQLVVTGMHLDRAHGRSVDAIRSDGWKVDATIPWPRATTAAGSARSSGSAMARLAKTFERLQTDVVLIVGDRVEAALRSEPDEAVLRRASDENRVVVTDDKDFGDLVVHQRLSTAGVLLLRLQDPSLAVRIARLAARWTEIERQLPGHLVVVSDRKIRARTLPSRGGA